MDTNRIKSIKITGLFDQFNVDWEVHPDVNILVGINGIGKSTILRCINALLSNEYVYLKKLNVEISAVFQDGLQIAFPAPKGKTEKPHPDVNLEYMSTFDIPLKNKKSIGQTETPLDKELQRVIYTLGTGQKSFSNYRFKATNYPQSAKKINTDIRGLFDLIDRLFAETGKKIEINPEDNALIFRYKEFIIPLEKLSSGEKQLLTILFTVFLMEKEPYIIMMDEPEISLHIGWQQQLIDVIRQLNPDCQLIIATHSPSIFGEGWGDKLVFVEDLMQS
ncbi:ABC transporter ATP-binding protein [Bacteroidia bacterium]|nr:ABC transporter ATP-binding protein [Bacteroidia bacterium]GHU73679.1 ABC transporter ATP-binding protein [Bacteroidia bacterium]